jgi:localization factor PodJL
MGEWLTRRILAGLSDMSEHQQPPRDDWGGAHYEERGAPRYEDRAKRDSEEMLDRVSRSETESASVYRTIDEQLRGMSRRLDSAERSQSESNRVMSKAAVEMNIAAREQSQAFDQLGSHVVGLNERLDRVERSLGNDGMREAVKALHQGLSRLADQLTETANQSATQISSLSGNLETLAGRLGQLRKDAQASTQALDVRIAALDERVHVAEKAAGSNAGSLEHALEALETRQSAAKDNAANAIARLEASMLRLESGGHDPSLDRRLSGIERAISEIVGRVDHEEDDARPDSAQADLKKLTQRLDTTETAQREILEEVRKLSSAKPEAKAPDPFALAGQPGFAAPFQSAFEPPPFSDSKPPFADPGFVPPPVPPPAYDTAAGFVAEQPAPPFAEPPPTVDSYLSAARRSARAASQAEAERSTAGLGGFGWNVAKSAEPRSGRSLYLGIGVVALVAIAVIAGVVLNHHTAGEAPANSTIGALFQKKPAPPPIKTETLPLEDDVVVPPSAAVAIHPAAPAVQKPEAKPAPVQAVPAPQKTVAVPPQKVASLPPAAQTAAAKPAPAPTAPLDRLTALANAGNAKAELVVGLKYLDGDGVPASDADGAKWLQRSAAAGEPVARYRLGTLYERGRGVAADPAKAAQWYEAAANQGNRKAMHNLAVAYAEGAGVKKDYVEASRWFSRAANLGLSDSQFNLAVLYERGLGVPQSLLNAYRWYAIAAAQGDAESKARLQAIAAQMSDDDRAAAQKAADGFKAAPLDARANVAPTVEELTRG